MRKLVVTVLVLVASIAACSEDDSNSEGGGSPTASACDGIVHAVEEELAAVAACEEGDACETAFLGSGCSDSPLPCCGFPHREGADLSALRALDEQYAQRACHSGAVACCDCAIPPAATCVAGVCTYEE